MKRLPVILIFALLLSAFTACGGGEADAGTMITTDYQSETTAEIEIIDGFDTENVVLSFWVLSDIHCGYLDQASKLKAAFKFINSNSPYKNNAVIIAGDILNSRSSAEAAEFQTVTDENLSPDIPVFFCLGPTHDLAESYASADDSKHDRKVIYKKLGERFIKADTESQQELYSGRRHTVINGYHFFAVDGDGYALTDENKDWLKKSLEAVTNAEPDKPVFVVGHLEQFGEACSGFPQVVYFSGHTHTPLNTGDAIKQTTFTSVHVGGLAYFRQSSRISSGNLDFGQTTASYAQGYRVDVDKNGCICLQRADFYYGEFIKEKWVIPAVNDENHLTAYPNLRRDGAAPRFPSDAQVKIKRVETHPSTVVAEFDAAESNGAEPVTQYVVSLYGVGTYGKETFILNKEVSSLYMLYPDKADMPKKYTAILDGVDTNIKLKAVVTAYDCRSIGANSISAELY